MGKRAAKKALNAAALVPGVLAGTAAALPDQPVPSKPPVPPPSPARPSVVVPLPSFKDTNVLKVEELTLDPVLPKPGETVTVRLTVRNESPLPLTNVAWALNGASSKSGTIPSLGPKSSQTVTHAFRAPRGAFEITAVVDPSRRIAEPNELRANNQVTLKSVSASATGDWGTWSRKAASQVPLWIVLCKSQTSAEGEINGPTLQVKKLDVGAVSAAMMTTPLLGDGIPSDVAGAIVSAFLDTYKAWAASYQATVPFAYPAFVAVPAPVAPPMPNVPFPLALGQTGPSLQALLPDTIAARIRARLSQARNNQEGGAEGVNELARALSGHLFAWITYQQVSQVIGTGPVPTFAPPYVPVGPVVQGSTLPAASHLP
jgi:hypothetical protein